MRRPVALIAGLALGLVTAAAAGRADAYCLTTTAPVEAGYNPVLAGCLGGTPLAWPSMPVGYHVFQGASAQLSLDEVTTIVDRSFAKWPAASCTSGDAATGGPHPALSASNLGSTDVPDPCDGSATCELPRDATPAIYFRDDVWPYSDSANEIALTTVTYGVDDGHIFAAVMEINSHDYTFSTTAPPAGTAYSLETVVTHEAGHFFGMAHSQETSAIMYAYYQSGALELTDDDVAGICALYRPSEPSARGCQVGAAGRLGWAGAPMAALALLAAWSRRRRSRRARVSPVAP